jgi:hypothetical protein
MSKQKKIVLVILMLGLLASISGVMLAPAAYDLSRYVIAGGGSRVQGTNYGVIGTMGQGVVGDHGVSAHYGACSGFWCGGIPPYRIFLPLVLRNYSS